MIVGYEVRFKGHLCAAVKVGFARKPILMRARKLEEVYVEPLASLSEKPGTPINVGERAEVEMLARIECARAVKRTEEARRRLRGDHLLRGVPSVERVLRDHADNRRPGSGKRWKICPVEI
jgi:hypothetical protein